MLNNLLLVPPMKQPNGTIEIITIIRHTSDT